MRPYLALSKITALLALAALAACGDDVTDPDALTDSAEAEAVLRSAAALPALPLVIERAGLPDTPADRAALFRAAELWASGVAGDDDRAAARRRLAVRYAAPVLSRHLGPDDWDAVDRGLREWAGTARSMLRHIALPDVERSLADAERTLDRAARAPPAARAGHLLLAGAELVETTPRFVARRLAREAHEAVERARASAPGDSEDPDLKRADRLKDWAARAVEEGDYLVAIQRAYYALQLVEGR